MGNEKVVKRWLTVQYQTARSLARVESELVGATNRSQPNEGALRARGWRHRWGAYRQGMVEAGGDAIGVSESILGNNRLLPLSDQRQRGVLGWNLQHEPHPGCFV